ncbi:hypothetical protein [Roseicella aquatilis]|uniref:Uncharacterized protein n=1 Tax=Roseicella aquatilis TaxID=2527868 RepID=A0A4V2WLP2_9PROT|nr:hypothetical protein [Roseicella aquatilis]TCZ63877.1 hypothetical protein EXY23_07760 [Roseicella aquatilis]
MSDSGVLCRPAGSAVVTFYGSFRFVTCTTIGAAARSTVEALMFRAVTRTLSFDQTLQSSTKAMLLVSSEASAKSVPPYAAYCDVGVGVGVGFDVGVCHRIGVLRVSEGMNDSA